MYKGKVDVAISVLIFSPDGSVYETHGFNPQTNEPFKSVEEAEQFLNTRLKELNSTLTENTLQNQVKIYVVDSSTNEQIKSGVVGQNVKLIVESNKQLPTTLYVPIKDHLSGKVYIISTMYDETTQKWESKVFPFNSSGVFNIDETQFKPVNKITDDDVVIDAYDVVVADV